jgi:hypothetical protein
MAKSISSKKRRLPERFCVRVHDGYVMSEIGINTDLEKAIRIARRHHSQHSQKTWVWSVRTGHTLFRLEQGQKAGAA